VAGSLEADRYVLGLLPALGFAPARRLEMLQPPGRVPPELVAARHLDVQALLDHFPVLCQLESSW
jgi:hypothetical protein